MFDDFSYTSRPAWETDGWKARTAKGAPGIPDASWNPAGVSFVDDPALPGNRLMRLTAEMGAAASQVEVCQQRKYLEGTYAARVRFTPGFAEVERGGDQAGRGGEPGSPGAAPAAEAGGRGVLSAAEALREQAVESFSMTTPYSAAVDPDFSTMDLEYLPRGGWGLSAGSLTATSWAARRLQPVEALTPASGLSGVNSGWRILLIQVDSGQVKYFVDGVEIAVHVPPNHPDSPMSIGFDLWFIDNGRLRAEDLHTYVEDVDWVFHAADVVMDTTDVLGQVAGLRSRGVSFVDSVPQENPPLDCPCDQ